MPEALTGMRNISEKEFIVLCEKELAKANFNIRDDIADYFKRLAADGRLTDEQRSAAGIMAENGALARSESRAVCQDTGYVQFYIEAGREVCIPFDLEKAANEAVRRVYSQNGLRMSIADCITRQNTGTNTPVFFDYEPAPGGGLTVKMLIKGGGSENVTKAGFLLPTSGKEAIIGWVVKAVEEAGAKACPPYIVGVGIGGTLEKALRWSKKNLLRRVDEKSSNAAEAELEERMLTGINRLPIGFQGLKFGDTALSVKVTAMPCHIATLPVAVSIGCNAVRQGEFTL